MKSKITLLFFCLGVSGTAAWAFPSVSIRTEAEPKEIYIGDPIAYNLTVSISSEVAFQPLSFSTAALGQFELLAMATPTFAVDQDKHTDASFRFLITTFSTGNLTIPSLPIFFSALNGHVVQAKTDEIGIRVRSLLEEKGDEGNIRPLKGLFDFKSYLWIWILVGVILLGVLGYFVWQWYVQQKLLVSNEAQPKGPPRPPEELAWAAIHELEDADLINSGQTKEFYSRLSVILREYLERRYGISAMESTTSELLAEFRKQNFPLMVTSLSRGFLDNADLVKFAKFTPTNEEVETDLNQVKQFINITTPKNAKETEKEQVTL